VLRPAPVLSGNGFRQLLNVLGLGHRKGKRFFAEPFAPPRSHGCAPERLNTLLRPIPFEG
jgi:hypothetical protein